MSSRAAREKVSENVFSISGLGVRFRYRLQRFWAQAVGRCNALLPHYGKSMSTASPLRNRVLTSLGADDFHLLEPHLEPVSFPVRHRLEFRNRPIKTAYFPERGIVSVIASGRRDKNIEVGIIGWEGMTGLPMVMGTDRSPHETYVQVEMVGHGIAAEHLRAGMDSSASMQRVFLNFAYVFSVQAAHTALANGRARLEERLARWLLMALDRATADNRSHR